MFGIGTFVKRRIKKAKREFYALRKGLKQTIKSCMLEVCSACQNDCTHCAHGCQRKFDPNYQLELGQLRAFLDACQKSRYYIEVLRIHGPGEPLLWKHLEPGLSMIKSYDCIGSVYLTTNGILLPKLTEGMLDNLDRVFVSGYQYNQRSGNLKKYIDKHSPKVTLLPVDKFTMLPEATDPLLPVPCECVCPGPMLFGDDIFLFCGPPVYGAANLMKIDVKGRQELYTAVEPGWYDKYVERGLHLDYPYEQPVVSMDLCRFCWANSHNLSADRKCVQSVDGGNWR